MFLFPGSATAGFLRTANRELPSISSVLIVFEPFILLLSCRLMFSPFVLSLSALLPEWCFFSFGLALSHSLGFHVRILEFSDNRFPHSYVNPNLVSPSLCSADVSPSYKICIFGKKSVFLPAAPHPSLFVYPLKEIVKSHFSKFVSPESQRPGVGLTLDPLAKFGSSPRIQSRPPLVRHPIILLRKAGIYKAQSRLFKAHPWRKYF